MADINQIFGGTDILGLLGPEVQQQAESRAQNAMLLNFALGALQASQGAPGMPKPSLGRVLSQAAPLAVGGYQQSFEKTLGETLKGLQMREMIQKAEETAKVKAMLPKVFNVESTPETRQIIPTETGDYESVIPGKVTGVSINKQMLPMLATAGPSGLEAIKNLASVQEALQGKTYQLKPGEQVVTQEGKVIAGVPSTPDRIDLGTHIAFVDPQNPTKIIGTLPKGKDIEKITSQELQVGQQFATQAQPFIQIGQAYKKIETAAKNPSAAGDISLIFGYMKLLDPGSVVREGEFATAQNAGSIPQSITSAYNRALNGERLAPSIRQDFMNQAKNLVSSQKEIFDQTLKPRFDSLVSSAGLNAANVMFNPFEGIDLTRQEKQVTQPQPQAPKIRQMMENTGNITVRRIQ